MAAAPAPIANTNDLKLAVTVLDAASNQPIAGAAITATGANTGQEQAASERLFVTDENGLAAVVIPGLAAEASWLQLTAQHSNYASRAVGWQSGGGRIRVMLGTNYTLKLASGIAIGGFVRDAQGQPVAGVRVISWGSETQSEPQKPGSTKPWEYSVVPRVDSDNIVTDTNGFWSRSHFPAEANQIWVELIRPGGARAQFFSGGRNQGYYGARVGDLDLNDVQAARAVLALKEGTTVNGLVVDEAGKPVAGARVREREMQMITELTPYRVVTGADGRFELRHRTGGQLLLSAEADGYAIRSVAYGLGWPTVEARLVLAKAQPARLRVLGEQNTPLAGARVQTVEWRNRGQLLDWKGDADADGGVVWTNAPREAVNVIVTATNYPSRVVRLLPGPAETIARLRPGMDQAILVRVRVQEAKTGQPLAGCEVLRSLQYAQGYTNWGRTGNDGVFQAELSPKTFQQGFGAAYSLMVALEGYGAWTRETIYFDEGDQDLAVSLKRARPPAGVVLTPDGQPAADANVILNTTENPVYSYQPGEYQPSGQGSESQRTASDGSFRFKAAAESHHFVISHRTGFAALTVGALPASGKISLQAWGSVEGQLHYGGQPVARENVGIKWPLTWAATESHHLTYNVMTDAQGRFVFTNLPPGEFVLYRQTRIFNGKPITESHRLLVTVKAGAATQVDYLLGGRTVTGHVEADGAVDWKNDPQVLEAKIGEPPPEPMYFGYTEPSQFRKARKEYAESPELLQWERKRQQFLLLFDNDGNFRADDVVPGTYALRLRVTKPPAKGGARTWYGNEEELGAATHTVVVPPGTPATEVDLGGFELALKVPGVPQGGPLALQGTTLAGRPFDLADLRGQPVVLLFWANWAPASVARLAELRDATASLGPHRRAAFLTVNLDDDVDGARRTVQGLEGGWTHARLEGASRVEVTERLEVDTLPVALVLNPEGVVAARDVTGKRLSALLDRLAKQPLRKRSERK